MKKIILTFLLLFVAQWGFSQVPATKSSTLFKEVKAFHWKTDNGLPYMKDFSGSYSVEVFQPFGNQQVAFLSKSEQAIFIFNLATGKKEKVLQLPFFPQDFAVADNRFFVAGTQNLYLLNANGKILDQWFFGNKIKFVNSMRVVGHQVYLVSPDQRTWSFDSTNQHFTSHDGVILNNHYYGKVIRKGKHQFVISLMEKNKKPYYKTISEKDTLGTVRILGMSGTLLFVEAQIVLVPVPLKVKREIRIYRIDKSKISQISSVILPDVYYTYVKHDIVVADGNLDIFVSTPEEAHIYQLNDLENIKIPKQNYLPSTLYQHPYLYNNHLLPTEEENLKNQGEIMGKPITRKQMISNAESFATHEWTCRAVNIKDYNCGGQHVLTPSWVTVGKNVSIPYMWGGFSSLSQFDQGLLDGVSAGDCDTHGYGAGSSCAVGVDCSGFVSRAWDLPNKYSTRSLPDISTAYSSYDDLRPGDIVNREGHHVRLIHTVNGNGSFLIIESSASGTDWRVGYNNYTTADLQGKYIPRYYNDIVDDNTPTDTLKPTTSVFVNTWETTDFQANFIDKDNVAVGNRFYQVSYYDDSRWLADNREGFFNDNFTKGIDTQWTISDGTWKNIDGILNQSDETGSNTNIYASVQQMAGETYLYNWRMKIGGTGTNRRGGMYIMVDDPTMTQRNNAYMIYFRVDQNTCQIYKADGNSIHLKATGSCSVDAGKWFDAKVIYNTVSGEIKVFKEDVLVSSWIDVSPITSGKSISLRTGNANISYDNMKVYRSRTTSENITVGSGQEVPYQNFSPSQPACLILSAVVDSMNNFSDVDSAFVNIDWTAPEMYSVADGLAADVDSTYDTTRLSAHWPAAVDTNSGIIQYTVSAGSSPGNADVIPWFSNGTDLQFEKTGLNLPCDSTYYVSVAAMNAAGLLSDTVTSDGVTVLRPLSVSEIGQPHQKVTIYPVPAKNVLWISFTGDEILGFPEVFDFSGKPMNVAATEVSSKLWKINLKTLPSGFYIVRIKSRTGYLVRKFSVVR